MCYLVVYNRFYVPRILSHAPITLLNVVPNTTIDCTGYTMTQCADRVGYGQSLVLVFCSKDAQYQCTDIRSYTAIQISDISLVLPVVSPA